MCRQVTSNMLVVEMVPQMPLRHKTLNSATRQKCSGTKKRSIGSVLFQDYITIEWQPIV